MTKATDQENKVTYVLLPMAALDTDHYLVSSRREWGSVRPQGFSGAIPVLGEQRDGTRREQIPILYDYRESR